MEEALRHALAFSIALVCALAGRAAHAEIMRFDVSQVFASGSAGRMTITGSFTGNLQNGRITDLSDIVLYRDGVAFRGNGALYTFQLDARSGQWSEGGYLSLDGSANNIMFIDTDYAGGDAGFFNYLYSVSGMGTAAFLPSFYRYQVPQTNSLSVRQQAVPGVPEPSAWAVMVLGFGALGAALRRRPAQAAHLA